jgi:hypothetical protein
VDRKSLGTAALHHTSQRTVCVCFTKTNQLVLFMKIIGIYFECCTKHINTLCGQNVVF